MTDARGNPINEGDTLLPGFGEYSEGVLVLEIKDGVATCEWISQCAHCTSFKIDADSIANSSWVVRRAASELEAGQKQVDAPSDEEIIDEVIAVYGHREKGKIIREAFRLRDERERAGKMSSTITQE